MQVTAASACGRAGDLVREWCTTPGLLHWDVAVPHSRSPDTGRSWPTWAAGYQSAGEPRRSTVCTYITLLSAFIHTSFLVIYNWCSLFKFTGPYWKNFYDYDSDTGGEVGLSYLVHLPGPPSFPPLQERAISLAEYVVGGVWHVLRSNFEPRSGVKGDTFPRCSEIFRVWSQVSKQTIVALKP